MPLLELLHTRTFEADMDRLRRLCFPQRYTHGSGKEEFDDQSIHVATRACGRLAGSGRLIPRPTDYFQKKSRGHVVVPDEADIVYFGPIMVAPEHRGHDVFELIIVEGLIYSHDNGFRLVFGGMRPERRFRQFVEELGFRDFGRVYLAQYPGCTEMDQALVADTRGRREAWYARKLATFDRLRAKGYEIIDRGCSAGPAAGEGQA
jgi:hypothetical protein